ncbi:hypothetical protein [Aquisalimonas asiatica]|uniref:Uncharacterized protein n=1 Tax=Aquisalimonas asiatica TaxID=406100 RepID=A0A1H8QGV7_9GAMM|nr:hypothetical protein [Aquisalimonas asiatica]SEO53465.1 hypothetical protein SAMN04488052_101580 [Aquisalimonas asiatica]
MSGSELLLVIILGELVIIVGLILILTVFMGGRRRSRDKRAAENLAHSVRSTEKTRDKRLRQLLEERYGYTGDELEAQVNHLLEAEKQFYTRFLDLYLNRDPQSAEKVHQYLQDVIRPYTEMEPVATPDAAAPPDDTESDDETAPDGDSAPTPSYDKRDMLEEIQLYRQTLNQVFAEYTAMFGIKQDSTRELSAQEIRQRMESGQLAGPETQ